MHEIHSILAGAQPIRPWRLIGVLGGVGLLFSAAIGYTIFNLASENAALRTALAASNQAPSRTDLLADRQRHQQESNSLRDELIRLQQEFTRRAEDSTRPVTGEELFVLEEMTRNAAWREGRTHDATLALLLDHLGVSSLAELTRSQWPDAIAHLYQIRKTSTRRAYDPVTSGQ